MDRFTDITQQVEKLGETAACLATGLLSVDKLCGGLPRGGVTVLGSRPGMGGTSFALSLIHQIAQRQMGNILIFSPRLRRHELTARLLEVGMGAPLAALLDGSLPKDSLQPTLQSLQASIHTETLTSPTLENILHRVAHMPKLQLLVIDGIECICRPVDYETKGICFTDQPESFENSLRCLKGIATSMNIPVLCTHHLHRSLENRQNKRPKLTDLKRKRLPEELADQVLFLYRDRYYDWEGDDAAECIVAKTPSGTTGTAFLAWDPQIGKFQDL